MTWTPERIQRMRELFEQGRTSREIAAALGGVTRNAVCGRLNRMGLKRKEPPKAKVTTMPAEQHDDHLKALARRCRQDGSSLAEIGNWIGRTKDWVKWHTRNPEDRERRGWMRKTIKERNIPDRAVRNHPLLHSRPCTLFDLREWNCRYPIGDPKHSNFRFCGARRLEPHSYCATHHKLTHSSGTWSERAATRAP